MIEDKIKFTGFRIGKPEAEGPRFEISWVGDFKGSGRLAGVEGTDMGTFSGIQRVDGVIVGEGQGVFTTKDGEILSYSFPGISVPTGPGQGRVRGLVLFRTTSPKFEWLKSTCLVWEEDDDMSKQEGYGKGYEWK